MSELTAAIEIGTSRTVIALGEPGRDGGVDVVALGEIPSSGIRKSQIIEMGQARYSIESVLKKIEDRFSYTIGHANLIVSGPQVRTTCTTTQWQLERGFVHEDDIAEIDNAAYNSPLPPERTLLDLYRLNYGVDNMGDIADPKGLNGNILKLRFLSIHGATQRINDAKAAARAAKLEIPDDPLPSFAGVCAANAVLTPQHRRDGALVIDLGGGSTTFTAWSNGQLAAAGVIGVGGDHVTNDIHTAFSVSVSQAEQLKCTAASAIVQPEDGGTRVPVPSPTPGFKAASVSRRALNTVVNARLQELFAIIRETADEENVLHKLNAGVFLTGGGAAMSGAAALAAAVFGCRVRIGTLVPEIRGLEKITDGPPAAYATIAGGLLLQNEAGAGGRSLADSFTGLFRRMFGK